MAISICFRVQSWCRSTFHDYVVFTKSIIFILGLILSYKIVEKTFLNILIWYLSEAWDDDYDIRIAAVVVNLQEGTSAVLVPLFVYAAEVYTGRFRMVLFSIALCITGLLLNYVAAENGDDELDFRYFYPALGLLTLAHAAIPVTLQAFFDDQLRPRNLTAATSANDEEADTVRNRRSEFWWNFVSFVAAILALFGPLQRLQLRELAIALITLMGGFFLVFLLGIRYYNFFPRIENPFKDVGMVIATAIANRKLGYPQTPQELCGNTTGVLHILPRVSWLRWLDRAAIVQEGRGSPSSVKQVRRVKLLLKMLPLWSSFLTLSLVAASGTTFFYEEADAITPDDVRLSPIIVFSNLMRFTEFTVSETSSYLLRKLRERKKYNAQEMELVRMGIGMSCCVSCCIAAWVTAIHRQRLTAMSVYWLTPQFFLLGLMEGLSEEGFESFYESQVPRSLSTFGPLFGEFMMGIGRFMSVLCIVVFTKWPFKWFRKDLGDSRLDKYYILLAVVSFGNFIIYCLVACWYRDDVFFLVVEDDEEMVVVEEGVASGTGSIEGQHISHRTVSMPKENTTSGDIFTESSTQEDPLLATKNISTYNLVRCINGRVLPELVRNYSLPAELKNCGTGSGSRPDPLEPKT